MQESVQGIYDKFALLNKALRRDHLGHGPACEFLLANVDRTDVDNVRMELLMDPSIGPRTIYEVVRYAPSVEEPEAAEATQLYYVERMIGHKWRDAQKWAENLWRATQETLYPEAKRKLQDYIYSHASAPMGLTQLPDIKNPEREHTRQMEQTPTTTED